MADVLLDCDGVLLDLTNHVLDWLNYPVEVNDIDTWDFFQHLSAKDDKRAKKLMGSDWFWKQGPRRDCAQTAVATLQGQGHEVTIVTSPWRGCHKWGEMRYQWLERYFGIKSADVLIGHKKWKVDGDVFVDDKPDHVQAWQDKHPNGRAYLATLPGNASFAWPHRIDWANPKQLGELLDFLDSCCHDK